MVGPDYRIEVESIYGNRVEKKDIFSPESCREK